MMRELIASWALPFGVLAVVLMMAALKAENHGVARMQSVLKANTRIASELRRNDG